jgi:hypothetical protein
MIPQGPGGPMNASRSAAGGLPGRTLAVSSGQAAHDAQRCGQPRNGIETFIFRGVYCPSSARCFFSHRVT